MNRTVVLHHADCQDGFGSAYAAWTVLGDRADYIPVQYGQPIPLGRIPPGADVFILDFSYDRETLVSLAQRSSRVVVLDHHKTAREALDGLTFTGLDVTFDMEKSGAVLAWEHFHPGEPLPLLLSYVQDRDLWRWELEYSRAFSAGLSLRPRDFVVWDGLARDLTWDNPESRKAILHDGGIVLKVQTDHVWSLAANAHWVSIAGHRVPAVNSPIWQSELGERLCELHPVAPFAAVFVVIGEDEEVWSLRSRGGFDVSAVARTLGGGGHPAAAGFKKRRGP